MRLKIHNVGHGGCITLLHENGNAMMWDCGHKGNHRPSNFLVQENIYRIHHFFVTNYDEDHISDLASLRQTLPIELLNRNPSIDPTTLRRLKQQSGSISSAMESMLDMMQNYNAGAPANLPSFPHVEFSTYYNSFFSDFDDTNNCSLVTFIRCNGYKFIIPGDVERAGWKKLLERDSFRSELYDVKVFVASHHGRESGYCEEVFNFCSPDVVIFSDDSIKYATQEMSATYAKHCSGTNFNGKIRYVLSTRNDGDIYWDL